MTPYETVVVGAGPAGLAVAAELRRRGVAALVLERGQIGESWHHHYDRLRLHTLKQVSGLPGLRMPASYPRFPSAAQVRVYLELYARHHDLEVRHGVEVRRAEPRGERWLLDTMAGPVEAAWLVAATGIWSKPFCPVFPGQQQYTGRMLHARDYRNPTPFQGQRVLVVGVGNSGAEIAVELSEAGIQTALAVRDGAAFVPRPRSPAAMRLAAWLARTLPRRLAERLLRRRDFGALGLPLPAGSPLHHYPVVGYELPRAAARGRVTVYPGIARLLPDGAWFSDGRVADFDTIILATGYRPALDWLDPAPALDPHGRPQVDRCWRALGRPRLSCVGFVYPSTEGWLQSIGRVAREAAEGIVGRCHRSDPGG